MKPRPLSKAQRIVLEEIRTNPQTPKELKEGLDLSPRIITLALKTLKRRGLVRKTKDPSLLDMRRVLYIAT